MVIDVKNSKMKIGTQDDEEIFYILGTPKECMKIKVNLVARKKNTTSSVWKKIVGCFKLTQQEYGEFEDYNLQTWFKLERVNPNLKDDDLRPSLPVPFSTSKSKNIFKRWGIKLENPWTIKKIRANGKIEIESPNSRSVKTITEGIL